MPRLHFQLRRCRDVQLKILPTYTLIVLHLILPYFTLHHRIYSSLGVSRSHTACRLRVVRVQIVHQSQDLTLDTLGLSLVALQDGTLLGLQSTLYITQNRNSSHLRVSGRDLYRVGGQRAALLEREKSVQVGLGGRSKGMDLASSRAEGKPCCMYLCKIESVLGRVGR